MEITRGKIPCAKKVVVYGPEGIGKSTFASCFPEPVFIDTEGSTKDLDVARLPAPTSWNMVLEEARYVLSHPEVCKTLVIDTADWAEQLCVSHVCGKYQKNGIEDFGYGKGYVFLQEEFGKLLNLLTELTEKGIHVVLNAHAKMRKFEQPDEMGAYDRWEMKLTKNVSPMVKEWADMVLFANYKTHVVKVDGKNKAQGGQRVVYTSHHSCWDAKNRYGLPEEIPLSYEALRGILEGTEKQPAAERTPEKADPPETKRKPEEPTPVVRGGKEERGSHGGEMPKQPSEASENDPPKKEEQMCLEFPKDPPKSAIDKRVPKALRDLMEASGVCEWDVENVVAARGYVPDGTPIWEFDKVNPGIIDGLLVPSWGQVFQMIQEMKETESIPFEE